MKNQVTALEKSKKNTDFVVFFFQADVLVAAANGTFVRGHPLPERAEEVRGHQRGRRRSADQQRRQHALLIAFLFRAHPILPRAIIGERNSTVTAGRSPISTTVSQIT